MSRGIARFCSSARSSEANVITDRAEVYIQRFLTPIRDRLERAQQDVANAEAWAEGERARAKAPRERARHAWER